MGLFDALGLDVKILFAQFINFAILVFVLWRFAYKPILKLLEDRRKKIEQGVLSAEAAELKLKEAEDQQKEIIVAAKKEALTIVEEAKDRAELKYQEIIKKSKEDIGVIINEERGKIRLEKEEVLQEIKREISSLLTFGVEKFLAQKIDSQEDAKIIKKITDDLGK